MRSLNDHVSMGLPTKHKLRHLKNDSLHGPFVGPSGSLGSLQTYADQKTVNVGIAYGYFGNLNGIHDMESRPKPWLDSSSKSSQKGAYTCATCYPSCLKM